jgi:hypothetical protein
MMLKTHKNNKSHETVAPKDISIFTPYYINQSRLLDLYSILHGGFIEYEELSSSTITNTKGTGKAETAVSGGFKLIKISGGAEAGIERASEATSAATIRKVQTVTSILGTVLANMNEKKYLKEIVSVRQGDFVNVPAVFSLNSLKKLLEMMKELVSLSSALKTIGCEKIIPYSTKQIDDLVKMCGFLFGGLEIFCESDTYGLIAHIDENNLYLSNIDDIIETEINCFAQVKKIHEDGATLLRNTLFSKIKTDKTEFIEKIAGVANNDAIDFGIAVCAEITGKPVYEVEIIALCK